MDDLTKLEINLEKLSEMFFSSLEDVRKFAPLISLENEENMENSKENLERIQYERLDNYEAGRKNYESNLVNKSIEINNTFGNIFSTLEELRGKDEFQNTDEELKKNLKDLKEWNELKIKSINDKIRHVEDIVNGIKREGANIVNNEMLD
jgi:hypothetical protein